MLAPRDAPVRPYIGARGMTEGMELREGFRKDYREAKMFSLWLKETLEILSLKTPMVQGGCLGKKLKPHPQFFASLPVCFPLTLYC